jgi:hypothetical protein
MAKVWTWPLPISIKPGADGAAAMAFYGQAFSYFFRDHGAAEGYMRRRVPQLQES